MRRRLAAAVLAAAFAAPPSPPGPIAFPRDHGAHADVPLEWWYWTGHLTGGAGREGAAPFVAGLAPPAFGRSAFVAGFAPPALRRSVFDAA